MFYVYVGVGVQKEVQRWLRLGAKLYDTVNTLKVWLEQVGKLKSRGRNNTNTHPGGSVSIKLTKFGAMLGR
jgi:hypothetical protein